MPQEFLVLQRFFLRVDDVMFRVFDTRMYCSFAPADGEPVPREARAPVPASESLGLENLAIQTPSSYPRVIRECRGAEASYADVKRSLAPHRPNDLSQLTNVNWVSETLERLQMQKLRAAYAAGAQLPPDLAPARLPHAQHTSGAEILGEVPAAPNAWEGDGLCIHVAVLRPPT